MTTHRALLGLGLLVPVLYFGAQVLAVPFYPDFSLLRTTASELGSERSALPVVFNATAVLGGVVTLLAVAGLALALRRTGTHWALVAVFAACVLAVGLSSTWAGVFPLPGPRHAANPFTPGLLLLPLAALAACWRLGGWLRLYLAVNLACFIALAGVFAGVVPFDRAALEGLLQRLLALTVYVPVGAVSLALLSVDDARPLKLEVR